MAEKGGRGVHHEGAGRGARELSSGTDGRRGCGERNYARLGRGIGVLSSADAGGGVGEEDREVGGRDREKNWEEEGQEEEVELKK